MIEILYSDGEYYVHPAPISFEELQATVGGMVELNHTREGDQIVQALCNEDGLSLNLPRNDAATKRFGHYLLMGPNGAVGNWVVLSGKDMLK